MDPSQIVININRRSGNLARRIAIYMACEMVGKTHREITSQFTSLSNNLATNWGL